MPESDTDSFSNEDNSSTDDDINVAGNTVFISPFPKKKRATTAWGESKQCALLLNDEARIETLKRYHAEEEKHKLEKDERKILKELKKQDKVNQQLQKIN